MTHKHKDADFQSTVGVDPRLVEGQHIHLCSFHI